jgi:hypothetical protein
MNDIQILIDELQKFRHERRWNQFNTSKDLALVKEIVLEKIRKK